MGTLRARPDIPTLTLIGAGEFVTDSAWPDPIKSGPGTAKATRAAYDLLRVDGGGIYGATAQWFRKEGGKLPSGFTQVDDLPVLCRFFKGGVRIAVIFFPALPSDQLTNVSGSKQLAKVLDAGRKASDADLVIGVSPWGIDAERAALNALGQVYHVLLGAGPGASFPGVVPDSAPGTLWSRPERRGRSITVLDFQELPARNPAHVWTEGVTVEAHEAILDATVPEDPAMAHILQQLR